MGETFKGGEKTAKVGDKEFILNQEKVKDQEKAKGAFTEKIFKVGDKLFILNQN